jgi:hypothetical protein
MESSERLSYCELKQIALDSYFDSCRSLALKRGYNQEEVFANVRYVFQDGLDSPVENAMWTVIMLVMSGGWIAGYRESARSLFLGWVSQTGGVDALLAAVPADEAEAFRHDAEVIGLLQPSEPGAIK